MNYLGDQFIKIIQIFEKDFPNNKKDIFQYYSKFYYDISVKEKKKNSGWSIDLQKTQFPSTFTKYSEGDIFQKYKEGAEYYIAFNDNGKEIGLIVVGKQSWNNTARIWDISINEESQRKGFGEKLLKFAEKRAVEWNCRAIVLECQSSNYSAIQFYLKYGYTFTGFDLIAYSNNDIDRHEVRLEMGKILEF
ncbi:MAG: GNAT family N-acetyltransferase [Candidatus Heimdallarchaeota archaeon]